MMLTLDEIKQKHGERRFSIDIPEWGGAILGRRLEIPDLMSLAKLQESGEKSDRDFEYLIGVIKMSLINEDGSPLIDTDHEYLLREAPLLVARLGQELIGRNNLGEDLKKNLAETTSGDSPSGFA